MLYEAKESGRNKLYESLEFKIKQITPPVRYLMPDIFNVSVYGKNKITKLFSRLDHNEVQKDIP